MDPVQFLGGTARAGSAALLARVFRGAVAAAQRAAQLAADKAEEAYGDEDPIYLVNVDISRVMEQALVQLHTTARGADHSFLEELHGAAEFTADATHSFIGSHHLRRMAAQATEMGRQGLRNMADGTAQAFKTAGIDRDVLDAARFAPGRKRSCRFRSRRLCRAIVFRWKLWWHRGMTGWL